MSGGYSFGATLRTMRHERHKEARGDEEAKQWTQEGVAKKLGVSRQRVIDWENGRYLPKSDKLKALADLFELEGKDREDFLRAAGQESSGIDNLPFLQNPFFTGREAYLEQIPQLLKESKKVAISGLGGIGKTQIALEYAYRHYLDPYRTILWVNAADISILQAGYDSLARLLLGLTEQDERDPRQRVEAVKQWLNRHAGWLLIIDNADELDIVYDFLPTKPLGHIILTTRWQFPEKYATPLAIEVMGTKEGQLFLRRRTKRSPKGAELDAVNQLVEALGGLALALEQAGAYIQETGTSFADYLKLYEENRHSLLDQYGALGDEHSEHPLMVAATFKTSLARARELSSMAEDILRFCAFLQPDIIPEELFQYDESFKADAMALKKGIAALRRYSLVKCNDQDKTFSLHRLVQAVLIDDMPTDLQKQWRERVVCALIAAFSVSSSDMGDTLESEWEKLKFFPSIALCATWTDDELAQITGGAELLYQLGTFLANEDSFREAKVIVRRALSITVRQQGYENPGTVKQLNELAIICWHLHDYEQSTSLFKQVLELWEKLLGPERPDLVSAHVAAWYLLWNGEYDRACAWLEHVLNLQEQRLGAMHPHTQETKSDYAYILRQLGRDAEAAALEVNDEPPV